MNEMVELQSCEPRILEALVSAAIELDTPCYAIS